MRLWQLALVLAVTLASSSVSAQPKKKKPKKPKTEQKDEAPKKDDEPPPSTDPPDKAPPPLDTNLREEDPSNPATNPWTVSGIAKKRDGSEASSSSDSGTEGKKKPSSDWVSRPIAVTATLGYATENLRIGFGARVGYSFLDTWYVGAAFTYHLGTTFGPITIGFYYPAAEVGYDYHIEGVTLRPYTGIGLVFPAVSGAAASFENQTKNALGIYPGIQVDYQVAGPGFVGIDGRVLIVLEDGFNPSIGIFGVGGARF